MTVQSGDRGPRLSPCPPNSQLSIAWNLCEFSHCIVDALPLVSQAVWLLAHSDWLHLMFVGKGKLSS